jgi:hypothetical protein
MMSTTRSIVILVGVLAGGRIAYAQEGEVAMPGDYAEPALSEQAGTPPPIPPYVEGPAVQTAGGGYCFEGPHPVDSSVEPGVTWDNTGGRHVHGYPPFDLRLFNLQNGCYYFIGDPTDFGYAGDTFSYYGAHPILATYGGGWCFMIGPHRHAWRPWSPLFATVGPWFYWEGPYDPFFWTYWPYYHFYYRAHYPGYYSHGTFFRTHAVAPRIPVVPRPPRFGGAWHGSYRGGGMPGRPGGPAPGAMPGRPGMQGPGAVPARPGQAAPGAMPARPMAPIQRGAAPSGAFAPHGYSAPAPRGPGSAPAPRGSVSPGGGHFGGAVRGGRR